MHPRPSTACSRSDLYDEKYYSHESDQRIVNVNGGAIALGHPLGCTGAKLCAQLMTEMQATQAQSTASSPCASAAEWVLQHCSSSANRVTLFKLISEGLTANGSPSFILLIYV